MSRYGSIEFIVQEVPNSFRDRPRLRKWLERVAVEQGTRVDQVSYVLMSDGALLTYNQRYLKHRDYTDVITFPVDSNNGLAGDILMSHDRIRENAKIFGMSAQQELRRVMVHGLLHLCGHHDRTAVEKKAMRALEDKYLAAYGRIAR